jgi:tetratricopeptide (TPR) repeat protein
MVEPPAPARPEVDYAKATRAKFQARESRVVFWIATVAALTVVGSPVVAVAVVVVLVIGIVGSLLRLTIGVGIVIVGLLVYRGWHVLIPFAVAALLCPVLLRVFTAPYGHRRVLRGGFLALVPHPRLQIRLARAQRLQRLDHPADALRLLTDLSTRAPRRARRGVLLRIAVTALRAGDLQQVLDACAEVRSQRGFDVLALPRRDRTYLALCEGLALLGIGRSGEALTALAWAEQQSANGRDLLRADAQLALGEALLDVGRPAEAEARFLAAASHFLTHSRFVDLAGALHGRARALVAAGSVEMAEKILYDGQRILIDYVLSWRRELFQEGFPARARAAIRQYTGIGLQLGRLTIDTMEDTEGYLDMVGPDTGVAGMCAELDDAFGQAQALDLAARRLENVGESADALVLRLTAVAALDERRYRLRSQTDRFAWAAHYTDAVDAALSCAVAAADPSAAAQVMEAARLQGVPKAAVRPPAPTPPRVADGTAARFDAARHSVALQLRGELPLRPPPVIRVRGDGRLLGPYAAERPAALDIESIASVAAGDGAWWWGQWSTIDSVYWSLVPPTGEVSAGRIDWGPESDLARLLDRLHAALPIQGAGETDTEIHRRVTTGELFDSRSEQQLMVSLGAVLVPDPLRVELVGRLHAGDPPLPLAVAPARALPWLPWTTLGIGAEITDGTAARMLHAANVILAPSAAMIDLVSQRPTTPVGPVRLAVLNPTGDLPETHNLRFQLPDLTLLLDDGTAGVPATKANLSHALTGLDRSSTVVFGCHAETATPGQPSTSALRLRPGDGDPGYLTAEELLADDEGNRRYPLPRTAVILGCESADVSGAAGAEWLTLGPAMLWAGADEALVTLYPIFKDAPAESDLLSLLVEGIGLPDAVSRWQRDCLAEWIRSGADWYSPVHWAGHSLIGRRQAGTVGRIGGGVLVGPLPPLSSGLAGLLTGAARTARELHQSVVTTGHLTRQYLEAETEMFQTFLLQEMLFALGSIGVVKLLRRERERAGTRADMRPSPAVRQAIHRARVRAGEMGSPTTLNAHLMLELVDRKYPDSLLLLRLTGLSLRPSFRRSLLTEARQRDRGSEPRSDSQAQRPFIKYVLDEAQSPSRRSGV